MKRKIMLWLCTLLGLLSGVALIWFLSLQTESTLERWIDELFYQKLWDAWVFLGISLLIPTLVGFLIGVNGNGFGRLFWTPIAGALAGFAALLLLGFGMVLWDQREIYGPLALVLLIVSLIPTTRVITVAIIRIRKW
jgi:hypothetical protein